jgi:hypothetical protein
MRIRVVQPQTNRPCATRHINHARRLRAFPKQICKRSDRHGGSDGVCTQRVEELLARGFGARGMRSGVGVFASDGGVVDEGVEMTILLLYFFGCMFDAGFGVDVDDD